LGGNGVNPAQTDQGQRRRVDALVQTKVIHAHTERACAAMLARFMSGPHLSSIPRPYRHGHAGWFIVVGCAAAAVHWCVAIAAVSWAHWLPLTANVAGWLVAFSVSFTGHHLLSFRGHGAAMPAAALRFFFISGGGCLINEITYAALLRWSSARYDLLLALVLVLVAGATYLLSRHWAFLRS
jgi:putative flippase GtrA